MPAPRPRPRPVPTKAVSAAEDIFILDLVSSSAPTPADILRETRVETASESEIDSQLASLTHRTSLEELARAGKTRNLKTLSERNLKEWIKEALRRVISSSATTLGAEEQERLLAQTRSELNTIMAERRHENDARGADAQRLAQAQDERDALARRLAAGEATAADRHAELERRAQVASDRRDALAGRLAALEAQLHGANQRADAALEAPLVDDEVLASLRSELAAARERALAGEHERAQLQRTLSKRLVASAEVVAAVLALDRRVYAGAHQASTTASTIDAKDDAKDDGEAEAEFYADEDAALQVVVSLAQDLERLHAELVDKVTEIAGDDGTLESDLRRLNELEWTRVHDSLIDDLQDQLAQAQAQAIGEQSLPVAVDPDEMAQLRGRCGELQSRVHTLSDELTEAKRVAMLAREAVARLLRENDKAQADTGTITQRITAADRRQTENERERTALAHRAEIAERQTDELRSALAAANRRAENAERAASEARGGAEAATRAAEATRAAAEMQQRTFLRTAEAENTRLARALTQAQNQSAATVPEPAPRASLPTSAGPAEVSDLHQALDRARKVITTSDGVPHEDVTGPVTATRKGNWLAAWADRKGRLKVARTVGDRWVGCGRSEGLEPISGVLGQPSVLMRGDAGVIVWHDADGDIHRVSIDRNGRQQTAPEKVGHGPYGASIARGAGSAEPFIVRVDDEGLVQVHDAQGIQALNAAAGLPRASGVAAAWLWALEGSRHCAYRSADGSIHQWLHLREKTTWRHADLTAQTQAPLAATDPIGYAPADHEHVLYLGVDGHVHELCFDGTQWMHHDLTHAAGAPAASGPPSGGYLGGRHTVLFRGIDGLLHLLRLRRDWRHHTLSNLGPSTGDPHLISIGATAAIIYTDVNGVDHLAQLDGNGEWEKTMELPS